MSAQRGPASLTLSDTGLASDRNCVNEWKEKTEVRLGDAEWPGRALLCFAQPPWESIRDSVELDAPACRHLANLLSRKAAELEAVVAEPAS